MSNELSADLDLSSLLATPIFEAIPEAEVNRVLNSPPFIPVPKALNLRTISSPKLPPNVIFRSGTLAHLPPDALTALKEKYNITTIFDLRGSNEIAKSPSARIEGIETVWISSGADFGSQIDSKNLNNSDQDRYGKPAHRDRVTQSEFATNDGVDGYIKRYSNVLEEHQNAYKAVFENLRDSKGAVLFHCTAGKDRTGILAALILATMEAPKEEIAKDYVLTRIGIEPFREYLLQALLQQMNKPYDPAVFDEPGMAELCGVRGPTIVSVLEWMNEKWGEGREGTYPGVEGYLIQQLGFTKEDIHKIKENLVTRSA